MTHEEMAAELIKHGWLVRAPITEANCSHPGITGSSGLSADGSGFSESYCRLCGYRRKYSWGPKPDHVNPLPMN